VYQLTGH